MRTGSRGFSLAELLVVVAIIGVLAAIAVPVFLNQRTRAEDSAIRGDVIAAARFIASGIAQGSPELSTPQAVVGALPADLSGVGKLTYQGAQGRWDASAGTFCVQKTVDGITYSFSSTSGAIAAGPCT